ncbi:PhzF family phenazine biosynthesis protein [Solirubrobacter phytolaccae]|uniref:PhzF family phenazine biosynthesis protein n=1 Tax=Solirubrobacter phytolaccae TaxID=1404360 RepID=A0A9X3SFN5_9ACTN|nr:PhzF family phenazine biosynthesis protein [Solirubrobacter phytolaccae]MDA0181697.1 PhzF family phenazine biosynthesis protein [Solirubrobacter phytolaccae]
MTRAYTVVDAFARRPLEGNPVAVFVAADGLSGELMQRIARELNLSETTFVLAAEGDGDFRVRIFTPVNELPFAGHPTLGTVVALQAIHGFDRVRLETAMGLIACTIDGDRVEMRQPLPTWRAFDEPDALLAALGVAASVTPVEIYRNGPRHVFVGVESVDALSALHPDHRALSRFEDVAVNCFAGAGQAWRARMFSPAYGVVEDAATGSAAGPLAVHLARHGLASWGADHEIVQGVEIGRRSVMHARAEGAGDRVLDVAVGGHAVVAGRGELYLQEIAR